MLKLSAPWIEFYNELECMFGQDPAIKLDYNDEEKTIKLYVTGDEKANALYQILPAERTFGNITIKVKIIPANPDDKFTESLFEAAFKGNPVVNYVKTVDDIIRGKVSFVVFRPEVVQFYNDNMADINGLKSTLYEDIARDIFPSDLSIFYCTNANKMKLF